MLELFIYVVLLLVGMPALLLGVGYFAELVAAERISWIHFPNRPKPKPPGAADREKTRR